MLRLLNLGFAKKPNGTYVCEDVVIEVRDNNKIYVPNLQMEMTLDELEDLMLAD